MVQVHDLANPTDSEKSEIRTRCRHTNMALYSTDKSVSREDIAKFASHFGLLTLDANPLSDDDGISSLQVSDSVQTREFIPYTNKAIQWHTDGYYNDMDHMVRSIILHCARQAESGGENEFFDHEILYILLRDRNPELIRALMDTDAMSIPPVFDKADQELRPERNGPVFSVSKHGCLHMRYTARTKSIAWKKSDMIHEALETLTAILKSDSEFKIRAQLFPGQGIICNNVLHNRNSFIDSETAQRLVYRARYFERISDT
ncbi:MAG: TauD/TfdA family dioxygenase [Spirochaetia bacterium]|nr:TauD/TfdA family dioxygenase [Spirochaetia bacterium]